MKRQIIIVDADSSLDELQNALVDPKAKIVSSVSSGERAIYVVETPNK
jgi:hypothetical protein